MVHLELILPGILGLARQLPCKTDDMCLISRIEEINKSYKVVFSLHTGMFISIHVPI